MLFARVIREIWENVVKIKSHETILLLRPVHKTICFQLTSYAKSITWNGAMCNNHTFNKTLIARPKQREACVILRSCEDPESQAFCRKTRLFIFNASLLEQQTRLCRDAEKQQSTARRTILCYQNNVVKRKYWSFVNINKARRFV